MTAAILWLWVNMDLIVSMALALHGLAAAIVNLTPTPKDDAFIGKAYKVIEAFALVFRKAKELPGEAASKAVASSKSGRVIKGILDKLD